MFKYFFWTTLVLLLSGGAFGFTITQLDPMSEIGGAVISIFYVSLFAFIWSLVTYLFFFGAELSAGKNLKDANFRIAMRRGVLVAVLLSGAAAMKMFNILGWIEVSLLGVFLLLLELIFLEK